MKYIQQRIGQIWCYHACPYIWLRCDPCCTSYPSEVTRATLELCQQLMTIAVNIVIPLEDNLWLVWQLHWFSSGYCYNRQMRSIASCICTRQHFSNDSSNTTLVLKTMTEPLNYTPFFQTSVVTLPNFFNDSKGTKSLKLNAEHSVM